MHIIIKKYCEALEFFIGKCYNNYRMLQMVEKALKCVFIYNPVSGKGKVAKKLAYIEKTLRQKYDEVEILATKKSGDMAKFARESLGKTDAIVFAGGDGSFNDLLQGVADCENMPEIGYIPSGTVNDIARTLKIPRKIKKALKVILNGRVEKLDCMKANDKYAMYVIAAGLFTRASYATDQKQKNEIGKIAYFIEGIRNEFAFDMFDLGITENGEQQKRNCVLVSFMNSRSVAGFPINRSANLQDGKIEVAIVEEKTNRLGFWGKVRAVLSVCSLFLFGYKAKHKQLIRLSGTTFEVAVSDDVIWNFDGEKGSNGKLNIQVIPARINMIVPKNFK